MPFEPKFVDLVRNYSNTTGTGNLVLGSAVPGYTSFTAALQAGDQFYYSVMFDKANHAEVGRGTLQADGTIARDPCNGILTNFGNGTKTVSLVTAAEWYAEMQARPISGEPADGNKGDITIAGGLWSINAGAPNVADKLQHMPDRTALSNAASGTPVALLGEAGREGLFTWSASDHSAQVAADPNQGIHIAPASDPTGKSGVWVRKFDGFANARWWGAKGDGTTDDSAAILAALATLKAVRLIVSQYGVGASHPLYFPPGNYWCNTTKLTIDYAAHICGAGSGQPGGAGTQFSWADQTGGFYFTGTSDATSAGWILERLMLAGGFVAASSAEGEYHAVQAEWAGTLRDVQAFNFPGDGLYLTGNGPTTNVDGTLVEQVFISGCRRGIYTRGGDANGLNIIAGDFNGNRQAGIWEAGFLGNTYVGTLCEANAISTWNTGAAGHPCCFVTYNGNRYACAVGQETWCSTNAPSGTTANNTGWIYWQSGGTGIGIPAWSSGINVRAGGGIIHTGADNLSVFTGCYVEGDEFSQVDNGVIITGALGALLNNCAMVYQGGTVTNAPPPILYGSSGIATKGNMSVRGQLIASNFQNYFGPVSGAAIDSTAYYVSTNTTVTLQGQTWSAGAPTNIGNVQFFGSGIKFDTQRAGTAVIFNVNGAMCAQFLSTGLWMPSGTTISISGTQVVGAQQTGTAADATDLASAIALVNDLKAKLVAHGLIA
ncbi:MAG TPA: glycosyl hydrolase family 28-related protein [Sphingomicrobium sp.]|nr:glycosyl hydrolase family 28-related protein [Sphingomicrobium sp.]